jgi:3-hydroxybutyryl-CoA dehydrogenase
VVGAAGLAPGDFLIEAATENIELKKKLFAELDQAARPGVILATNTSSISITLLAAVTSRPERVVGMHFMNPVPVMKLVEIIRGLQTADDTYALTLALAQQARQDDDHEQGLPGLPGQPHLDPADQRGRLRAAGGARQRRRTSTRGPSWASITRWGRSSWPT